MLPRCLLCSMHCAVGAKDDGLGHVGTVYPADLGVERGACVRALTAARLLGAPERFFEARQADEPALAADVIQQISHALKNAEGAEVAVIADLNRPMEGVTALAELCRKVGARFGVFAPPEDLPLVRAGVTGCPPFARIAECDQLFVVGDPFSTHPAIAAYMRDVQFGARGNRIVCVDAANGRTARGADTAILVPPAKLAAFMAAAAVSLGVDSVRESLGGLSAERICDQMGLDREQIGAWGQMREAKAPGIILSNSVGRYSHPGAVSAIVGEIASAVGCPRWPLLTASNSYALPYLRERYGALSSGEVLEVANSGAIELLLVVGWDPSAVLPERFWRGLADKCETVCWAGSIDSPFAQVADIVLPLALAWEEKGTVLDAAGKPAAFEPWLAKPAPVLDTAALADGLAFASGLGKIEAPGFETVGTPRVASEAVSERILEAPEPASGEAIVVGAPEPHGYGGGIPLGVSRWQRRLAGEEAALVTADLAREVGLEASGLLKVSDQTEFTVPYRLDGGAGRVVAMPAHWGALRELLQWQEAGGALEPAPALVQIEKCE